MTIYMLTPSGGTITLVGGKAKEVSAFMVRQFGYTPCTQQEWRAARKRQQAEEGRR